MIGFEKRADNSAEKKPVSPISGLNEHMKNIEEKILRFKTENASFEKKGNSQVDSRDYKAQAALSGNSSLSQFNESSLLSSS